MVVDHGKFGPQRKLAILAIFFHSILQKAYQGAQDKSDYSQRVHGQPYPFIGPYRVLQRDLLIFEDLSASFTISKKVFYENPLNIMKDIDSLLAHINLPQINVCTAHKHHMSCLFLKKQTLQN